MAKWKKNKQLTEWAEDYLIGTLEKVFCGEQKPILVFCYQNCSDLLWEKIVLVIEKKLLKLEAEGWEFAKILRSLDQFIQTVKGQNNFW